MEEMIYDTSFDKEFKKIDFFRKHESYLPYVGKNYRNSKLKILHVGNCHYIEQSQDPDRRYGYRFFRDNWFQREMPVFPEIYHLDRQMIDCKFNWRERKLTCENAWNNYCLNTRNVVSEMLTAQRNSFNLVGRKNYTIFTSVIKVLSETVGQSLFGENRTIDSIKTPQEPDLTAKKKATNIRRQEKYIQEVSEYQKRIDAYTYVAFTDFHMMPALVRSDGTVLERLIEVAKEEGIDKAEAQAFYEEIVIESSRVLDAVISILDPDVIYITSKPAGEQYMQHTALNALYKGRIYCDAHPNAVYGDLENYKKRFGDSVKTIIHG